VGNVQLISDVYDAMGRGDVAHLLGAMDPQIEWREAEGSPYESDDEAWIGHDAILENVFVKFVTEWDGFAVEPVEFHDAGTTVVVEGATPAPTTPRARNSTLSSVTCGRSATARSSASSSTWTPATGWT
jgi:ketosteroid isomerase-like protein